MDLWRVIVQSIYNVASVLGGIFEVVAIGVLFVVVVWVAAILALVVVLILAMIWIKIYDIWKTRHIRQEQ